MITEMMKMVMVGFTTGFAGLMVGALTSAAKDGDGQTMIYEKFELGQKMYLVTTQKFNEEEGVKKIEPYTYLGKCRDTEIMHILKDGSGKISFVKQKEMEENTFHTVEEAVLTLARDIIE